MSGKNIIIIGGGISGLTTLHFLRQKFADRSDISILLLEKNAHAGGTIQSIRQNGYLFETGPNGFLNNKPRTIEFFESLGLKEDLMEASPEAKSRYIALKNKLYPIPANPQDFLCSPLLNPFEKARVLKEIFIPKGNNPQESIFEFGQRRLGKRFAEIFLDAMVAGIHGGDAREINLKAAFPRIYNLEQEYGSLFKAMFALKKKKKENAQASKNLGMPSGTLTSFRNGMGQGVEALTQRYKEHILFNQEVRSITREPEGHGLPWPARSNSPWPAGSTCQGRQGGQSVDEWPSVQGSAPRADPEKIGATPACRNAALRPACPAGRRAGTGFSPWGSTFKQNQWTVEVSGQSFVADELFLCCPAHSAARMLQNSQPGMAQLLQKIYYAPIAIVGLGFSLTDFKERPKGFGFLIPSSEKKEILGVLFDSNIFPGRSPEDKILFRIMLGGARSPNILERSQEELIQIAFKELQNYFGVKNPPRETFFKAWPKAIPQYDRSYVSLQEELERQLSALPSVHIVANYWKGISLNDCIENASRGAEKITF